VKRIPEEVFIPFFAFYLFLVPDARGRGRPRTAWMDNIKTWTGLSVEESIRMTENRENVESKSMMWPTLGSRTAKEQNSAKNAKYGGIRRNYRPRFKSFFSVQITRESSPG